MKLLLLTKFYNLNSHVRLPIGLDFYAIFFYTTFTEFLFNSYLIQFNYSLRNKIRIIIGLGFLLPLSSFFQRNYVL